jgi:hypothetical protein
MVASAQLICQRSEVKSQEAILCLVEGFEKKSSRLRQHAGGDQLWPVVAAQVVDFELRVGTKPELVSL